MVRGNGSQTPFQNEFWNSEKIGIYVDIITGEPLFASVDKFDTATSVCLHSQNRFRKISSSRCPTIQTRCNAPRCAPSEVMLGSAMSFPTRNRARVNDTSFIPPPFISFPSTS